ncbi:MAG TPA: DUF6691 family protein [Marinagarivorans sp.]
MNKLMAVVAGLLFGVGLAASGMTDPAKVLGFLDIFGDWVPDLAFVMGGAVLVTLVSFRFILKRQAPVCDTTFHVPNNTTIDKKLLIGAALFGIGWGIYGYCPGPALGALVYLKQNTVIFVVAMLAGMWGVHRWVK